MKFEPNKTLPEGACFVSPPENMQLGGYVELTVDATLERHGLKWYRIQGGFGSHGDRDDWIADTPGISISVSDYNWNRGNFGKSWGDFEQAIVGEMRRAIKGGIERAREKREQAEEIAEGVRLLKRALKKLPAKSP